MRDSLGFAAFGSGLTPLLLGLAFVYALGVSPIGGCTDGRPGGDGGNGGGPGGNGGNGGMPECERAEDCDDGNQCTEDACTNGMCEMTPLADGTACGDDAGTCREGNCTMSCSEQGIRDAIAAGGGVYAFDCSGPTNIVTEAEIVINNDVVLDGEELLTLDGNDSHRVVSVQESVTVELRGFTITRGYARGDRIDVEENGGGIWNHGTLTLNHCVVVSNTVQEPGGAGIFNRGGVLTLTDSEVTENAVTLFGDGGAGIYSYGNGSVNLTNSTVSDNQGGGVYMRLGGATLTKSTVTGNTGTDPILPGDGIYSQQGVTLIESTVADNAGRGIAIAEPPSGLTMTDSTVSGNGAGGIWIGFGNILVRNSTISQNTAEAGGGVWIQSGLIRLTNSTISGNSAARGGGIHAINNAMVWVSNSTVADNRADESGSAVYSAGQGTEVLFTNSLVDGECFVFGNPIESNGYNIESPGDTCGFDQPSDLVEINTDGLDGLNLGPLEDNGGPTQTHTLLTLPVPSIAIDRIPEADCVDADGATLEEDQRGEARPAGAELKCDVGSVEVQEGVP